MKFCLSLLLLAVSPALATTEFTNWYGGANQYFVSRVATDAAGDTFIAGTRTLPVSSDIFVIKLDPSGNVVLFREISGGGVDTAADMAIDSTGNIYVAGSTTSLYFPTINAMQTTPGPGFLFKISADGSQFLWSTYYRERIAGLAVDSSGSVYITGSTFDPNYPITPGLPAGAVFSGLDATSGAFLTKISPAGTGVVYSAVIAGTGRLCPPSSSCFLSEGYTNGVAVAVDAAGDAFLAGNTNTATLPTTSGAAVPKGTGAFIASVKADGSALAYLTFVGSAYEAPGGPQVTAGNTATAIAADKNGNVYLAGSTFDLNFPATTGAYQTTYGGPIPQNGFNSPTDAFALKLNPAGTSIVWASYLGGSGIDSANSIAVDSSGQTWIAGTTASSTFPNATGFIAGSDFVAGFGPNGTQLVYSSRFPNNGTSRSIAVDPSGFVHVAGPTGIASALNPASSPATKIFGIANAANGPLDGRIAFYGEAISIYGPNIGPSTPLIATPDSTGNLPTQLGGYQVTMGGTLLPLLYVSGSQINAIATTPGNGQFVVITPSGETPVFNGAQIGSRPEIFRNADNSAIAVNQDGTLNSQANPAHLGTYESIWITGAGAFTNVSPGLIATAANDLHCCSVLLGGLLGATFETVSYAGYSPGVATGVLQVNFLLSSKTSIGSSPAAVDLNVTGTDGTESHTVTLWVAN